MTKTIELTEQEGNFLSTYLESELENEKYLSNTTRVIFQQIFSKLNEE